jgi:hypothetical protein
MDAVDFSEIFPRDSCGWTDAGLLMLLPAPSRECIPNAGPAQAVFPAAVFAFDEKLRLPTR